MFQDIQSILPTNLQRAGMADKLDETRILSLYKSETAKYLGPELSGRIRPLCLENGSLYVASLSDQATDIIRTHEPDIVMILNNAAGRPAITQVKYLT